MTSPGGDTPARMLNGFGGIAAWSTKTRAEYESEQRGQITGSLSGIDAFGSAARGAMNAVPELRDGQSALEGRTDLLDTGFLHLIQGKNWTCPRGQPARKIPFDTQVGPPKDAVPSDGGARLLKKGLWRADALICWEKATAFFGGGATGDPVYTAAVLAVHRASDNYLLTRKHMYETVLGQIDPTSVFWSHEFVVPTDNTYDVSVWVGQNNSGGRAKKLHGGIQYTGLWVTQLSHSTDHPQPSETVSDGGTLPT